MSLQIEKQRQKHKKEKGKFKIRVRYRYHDYKTIGTDDYGSYREMYSKYKGKYEFYCADIIPDEHGHNGVRLDSDWSKEHEDYTLQRFGRNKAWIDPTHKVNGKSVVLVFNAQFDVGTFGTVTSASVGINTVARLNRERRRKAKARARKKKWHTNRRTKRKYRH